MKKKVNLYLVFFTSFLFMELLYKILIVHKVFDLSLLYIILFLIPLSIFCMLICNLFKNTKINKSIYLLILSLITIWFCIEYVCKSYFDFYVSLSTFKVADQLGDFIGKTLVEIAKRIPGIICFFLPLILSIIFFRRFDFNKKSGKKVLLLLGGILVFIGLNILALNIHKDEDYSAHNLYYEVNDVALNMETFGVLHTFTIDLKRSILGFEEKILIDNNVNVIPSVDDKNTEEKEDKDDDKENDEPETETPEVPVYEYNNLDIDFASLLAKESNKTLKQMHEYFKNDTGTLKNEYTGMFKDKNLILFMAESFNEVAVRKDVTPTLYKLVNSGFSFKNFYTPTIYSTIGGEFQELTGLYASGTDILSKFRSGNIAFPQGVSTKFEEMGYRTFAYHNNYATFQNRDKYLKSLGFDNFKACNTGLEKVINCNKWPRSDMEMIDATVGEYVNNDHFMVFYATNSGHSDYLWNANAMAKKHKEEYLSFGLNYSEKPSVYLAAQMDLDQALELLIKKLDEAGKLEDTVIALVGDHYPYDIPVDEINELSDYKRDDKVEINSSSFILWNSEMETVNVNKVGSQLDVIPTIYNLFGIDYDSRLFIGKDILSTEGGLAIFGDRSWVSDLGTYFYKGKNFVPNKGVNVPDDYVKKMNQIVNNKITMSKLIIDNNYYAKVFK